MMVASEEPAGADLTGRSRSLWGDVLSGPAGFDFQETAADRQTGMAKVRGQGKDERSGTLSASCGLL